jgi:hypothetical protein
MIHSSNGSERYLYYLISVVLGISLLGVPIAKYSVYLLPVFVFIGALLLNCIRLNVKGVLLPFVLLVFASIPTAYDYDINSLKKIYFIFSYAAIFILVDFSRIEIKFYFIGFVLFFTLLLRVALFGAAESDVGYSIMDSQSMFESTLSFPFALLSSYYILKSRWFLSSLYLLLVFITLKRIAIVSVLVTLLARLVPIPLRGLLVNPYTIAVITLSLTSVTIMFAYGFFNDNLFDIFGHSANDLSKGRQRLWYTVLNGLHYDFTSFFFYGEGVGKTISELQHAYGRGAILLHNDLLGIYLEFGLVAYTLFLILLVRQRAYAQKIMSISLVILLFTDNVIIYQHVMIVFLLIQSQLEIKKKKEEDQPEISDTGLT